tara:strand:- start:87 stop:311 length:225 start_codon:yes stop_codon:yes gene_type:complete
MTLYQLQEHRNLARDTDSGAVINIDQDAYNAAICRQLAAEEQKDTLERNTNDINSIKTELTEIKTMIRTLIDGN